MNNTHADAHWSPNENVTTNTDVETSRTFVPSGTTTTTKTEQFQYAPIGWICPKCGRGLAPPYILLSLLYGETIRHLSGSNF